MKFQIKFTLHGRQISNGYCTVWSGTVKPNDDSARLMDIDEDIAILDPLFPNHWMSVKIGDVLDAFEGKNHVITAIIKDILIEGTPSLLPNQQPPFLT